MSDINKAIWEGSLKVDVKLHVNDSNNVEQERHFLFRAYRNSYFPLYFEQLLQFFKPYLLVSEWSERAEWWLEFEEVPIKWNLPIGLLYDTLTVLNPQKRTLSKPTWELTLHYRNYPEGYILPLPSKDTLQLHWLNQIKESCYVQNGTAKPIMTLSKNNTSELWNSVESHNSQLFNSLFLKVSPNSKQMKHVPLRFYLTFNNKVIDVPVKPCNEDQDVKIGETLHELIPELFPSTRNYILAKPVLHGVTVPITTPLAEIYHDLTYIDGFIHISIILIT